MSTKQTDELLLYTDSNEEAPVVPPQDLSEVRERLRLIEDLKRHPGYKILIDALKFECEHSLLQADRAEKSNQIIKHSAQYAALLGATRYCDLECARLTALLVGASK